MGLEPTTLGTTIRKADKMACLFSPFFTVNYGVSEKHLYFRTLRKWSVLNPFWVTR